MTSSPIGAISGLASRTPHYPDASGSDIDSAIAQLEGLLADMKEGRNVRAPIARLPSELLVDIFAHVALKSERRQGWLRFSHVCRGWRRIALRCPALWANIDVTCSSLLWWEEMLARSQSVPLAVSLRTGSYIDESTLRRVYGKIACIGSLFLSLSPAQFGTLTNVLSDPSAARILQKLSVHINHGGYALLDSEGVSPPPKVVIPQLRALQMSECLLNLDSLSLSRLEVLDLFRLPSYEWLTVSWLLDCLSLTPCLKLVRLRDIFGENPSPQRLTVNSRRTVLLAHLHSIELTLAPQVYLALVPSLIIPSNAHMHLDSAQATATSLRMQRDVLLEFISHYVVPAAVYNIVIETPPNYWSDFSLTLDTSVSISGDVYRHRFSFTSQFDGTEDVLSMFEYPLSLLRAQRLTPKVEDVNTTTRWQEFFSHFPDVEEICVEDNQSARMILAALSPHDPEMESPVTQNSPSFSNLRSIVLNNFVGHGIFKHLGRLLAARSAWKTRSAIQTVVFVNPRDLHDADMETLRGLGVEVSSVYDYGAKEQVESSGIDDELSRTFLW